MTAPVGISPSEVAVKGPAAPMASPESQVTPEWAVDRWGRVIFPLVMRWHPLVSAWVLAWAMCALQVVLMFLAGISWDTWPLDEARHFSIRMSVAQAFALYWMLSYFALVWYRRSWAATTGDAAVNSSPFAPVGPGLGGNASVQARVAAALHTHVPAAARMGSAPTVAGVAATTSSAASGSFWDSAYSFHADAAKFHIAHAVAALHRKAADTGLDAEASAGLNSLSMQLSEVMARFDALAAGAGTAGPAGAATQRASGRNVEESKQRDTDAQDPDSVRNRWARATVTRKQPHSHAQ